MSKYLDPILKPFKDMNYVYSVELLVIASIVILLLFVFYQLGLFRKT